ncbi:MAG: GYD domain-containing protein [Actinomycetota bacterium]|nr:GYD domain-containing protein [Actinomycetota bacterium]
MSKFIGFVSYTPEAWAHMISEGIDREAAIREIVEHAGGVLENAYWLFSQYDLIGVFEVPNEVDAMAICYAAYSSGSLKHIEFHAIIPASENATMQCRAKELTEVYKAVTHPDAHRHV